MPRLFLLEYGLQRHLGHSHTCPPPAPFPFSGPIDLSPLPPSVPPGGGCCPDASLCMRSPSCPTAIASTLSLLNSSESAQLLGSREPRGDCIRCAVVGNGGILNGSRQGLNIDAHDYVFRYAEQGQGGGERGREEGRGAAPRGSILHGVGHAAAPGGSAVVTGRQAWTQACADRHATAPEGKEPPGQMCPLHRASLEVWRSGCWCCRGPGSGP